MDVKLHDLGKRYRYEWIFRNINFNFEEAHSYAILGHNGSGKSTFLKILSGFLSPSKGSIHFNHNGKELSKDDVYQYISFAAPYIELIEEYNLTEALSFHQKFKPFLQNLEINDLVDILDLPNAKHKEIRYFSSGMKQRLKLVLAICTDTPLLLLDEPTTNLDRQGMKWYQDLLEKYAKNRLVIIASNVEVDYVFCDKYFNVTDFKG